MSGSNKDKCINCKKETLYGNKTHTDFRIGYVEGAGQLCLDCYGVIYGLKPTGVLQGMVKVVSEIKQGEDNDLSDYQMGEI